MTIAQIIDLLRNMEHEVKWQVRKDGGIRITNINGQKFTGSTGNTLARELTGQALSERRTAQLKTIKSPKGQWGHRKKAEPLDDSTIKKIQKAQRIYRKNQIGNSATVTRKRYRYNLKHHGKEEADRRLNQAIRYGLGLAYDDNINALINRLKLDNQKVNSPYIDQLIELIESKRDVFKESWLNNIYDSVYEFEQGRQTPQWLYTKVSQIINS